MNKRLDNHGRYCTCFVCCPDKSCNTRRLVELAKVLSQLKGELDLLLEETEADQMLIKLVRIIRETGDRIERIK